VVFVVQRSVALECGSIYIEPWLLPLVNIRDRAHMTLYNMISERNVTGGHHLDRSIRVVGHA